MKHKYRKGAAIKPKFNLGAMLKKYIDGGMLENGTNASGYNTTVLGGQYTSDSPYGDVRRRTVSEGNLNTFRLQREFDDRLEYFMDKYPSMNIEDARQEVMKQMAQDNGFMSRIDLIETARRGRPSDTQAGKRLMMEDGGIMKYPGGGLMPKQYEDGGPMGENGDEEPFVLNNKTANDPGFQAFLKSTNSTYYPTSIARADFGAGAVRGVDEPIGRAEYARFLRSDEAKGVPLAVNPDTFDFEAMENDPLFNQRVSAGEMPGDPFGLSIDSRSGRKRYRSAVKQYENFPTFFEVAKQQAARYESNKDLERRYNEYLMKQRQPQRVGPRESVEYTPSGLTAAERRLLAAFNQ